MRRISRMALVFLVVLTSSLVLHDRGARAEEPQTPPEGFQAIFTGKDLSGWEGSSDYWSVKDGCLTGVTDGSLKYNRFIIWRGGTLKNFELRVKVKVTAGGNSGLNYRSQHRPDLGDAVVTGYQCDVVPGRADYNGMLYEERGRRILAHTGEKVIIAEDAQPWVVDKLPIKEFKADEWHEYRVLVQGNHHQHWIDGHQTVDVVDLDEKGRALDGILGVQVHVGPAMQIQYRDFWLKLLPADLPLIKADDAKIPATAVKVVPQGGGAKKK
jgi:3-keto-disaccharide hydrolase